MNVMKNSAWKVGVSVLLIVHLVACGDDKSDMEYVEQAKLHQDAGELSKAEIELKNALRVNPESSEARRLLGMLYLTIGNGAGAEKELRRAAELKVAYQAVALPILQAIYQQHDYKRLLEQVKIPDGLDRNSQAEWYVTRGRALLEMGRLQEARQEIQLAYRVAPDSIHSQLGRAMDAAYTGNYTSALSYTDTALAKDGNFADALVLKGVILQAQGDFRGAESFFTRAIEARKSNYYDIYKRARVRLELLNIDGAEKDIQVLASRVPKSVEVSFLRGLVALIKKNYDVAEAEFRNAVNIRPSVDEIQYYLAITLGYRNQPQQARAMLEALVTRNPDNYLYASKLVRIYIQDNNLSDARNLLDRFRDSRSTDVEFWMVYNELLLRTGLYQDALTVSWKLLELDKQSVRSRMLNGSALMGLERYDGAIDKFNEILQAEPENGDAYFLKIRSQIAAEKYSDALETAGQWVKLQPLDVRAWFALAQANVKMDDYINARKAYEHVLAIQNDNSEAVKGLAELDRAARSPIDALDRFAQLWKASPGNVDAALVLAMNEFRHGNDEVAKTKLMQAIEKNDEDIRPRLMLGRFYLESGKIGQALSLLRPVENKFGNDPGWLALMVECLIADGNANSAKDLLDRLQKTEGEDAKVLYWRSQIYLLNNQPDLVLSGLEKGCHISPDDLRICVALLRRYVLLDEVAKAESLLNQLVLRFPGNVEIQSQQGWLKLKQKKYTEAYSLLQSAYQRLPTIDVAILFARASVGIKNADAAIVVLQNELNKSPNHLGLVRELSELYLMTARQNEAIALMKSSIGAGGRDPVILNNLAWIMRINNPGDALKYAEMAEQQVPDSGGIKDTLGQILMQQGQVDRGVRVLSEAVRLSKNDVAIRLHYAEALFNNNMALQAKNELNAIEAMLQKDAGKEAGLFKERIAELRSKYSK